MDSSLISVIVPVYNNAPYIDKCVNSIVRQTYKKIEIILIDDGSTDESGLKCEDWQGKDGRIKVIHTENYGVSHARNIGLDISSGEYVSFIDSDDWVESNYYEEMISLFYDNNIDICCGGYLRTFNDGGTQKVFKYLDKIVLSRERAMLEMFKYKYNTKGFSWELCDKLIKKELLDGIRFDESIYIGEDQLVMWKLMKKVKSFGYIPLLGYHYRVNINSAMHSADIEKKITGLNVIKYIYHDGVNENEKIQNMLFYQYIAYTVRLMIEIIVQKKKSRYDELMRENREVLRENIKKIMLKDIELNIKIKTFLLSSSKKYHFVALLYNLKALLKS